MKNLIKIARSDKEIKMLQELMTDYVKGSEGTPSLFNLASWLLIVLHNQEVLDEKLKDLLDEVYSLRGLIDQKK